MAMTGPTPWGVHLATLLLLAGACAAPDGGQTGVDLEVAYATAPARLSLVGHSADDASFGPTRLSGTGETLADGGVQVRIVLDPALAGSELSVDVQGLDADGRALSRGSTSVTLLRDEMVPLRVVLREVQGLAAGEAEDDTDAEESRDGGNEGEALPWDASLTDAGEREAGAIDADAGPADPREAGAVREMEAMDGPDEESSADADASAPPQDAPLPDAGVAIVDAATVEDATAPPLPMEASTHDAAPVEEPATPEDAGRADANDPEEEGGQPDEDDEDEDEPEEQEEEEEGGRGRGRGQGRGNGNGNGRPGWVDLVGEIGDALGL